MTPGQFKFIRDMLKERSGLTLGEEKQYLLEARLLPLARERGLEDLGALAEALKPAGAEELRAGVTEAMTINETFFFRDKAPFENFRDIVAPAILDSPRAASRTLRIWCAAASTGQEPYSLAMQVREMGSAFSGWNVEILATDISDNVLEKARTGLYSQFEVQRGLPIQLLVKYFRQTGSMWQLDASVRSMVTYRQFNLLDDFAPLGAFDIVFCRNVLIYFDQETKAGILARIAQRLGLEGYLVLGAAETVIGLSGDFRPVPDARGLYTLDANGPSRAQVPAQPPAAAAAPETRTATTG